MKVKVFTPNERGKIEFTREELEKLLDEIYSEGQKDCNCNKSWTWATPYTTTTTSNPSSVTHTADNTAIDNLKADITISNKETKPYSITMKINEADINKAAESIKAMLDQKGALTPQRIEDVFSGLAKELNF